MTTDVVESPFRWPKNAHELRKQVRIWWESGTLTIGIGLMGLFLIALDRYFVIRQTKKTFEEGWDNLDPEEMIHDIVLSAQQQRQLLYQQYRSAPTLYQCRVVRPYQMGGSHGLPHVQMHDVVEVLEENVGPHEAYHLCRFVHPPRDLDDTTTTTKNTPIVHTNEQGDVIELGWYPKTHLERYTPPRPWWRRLLFV